jgi:hypothetical protein
MNAKRKGTRNEHRSRQLLDATGYAVTRAAASLGMWDLIGIGSTDVVLVQVKSNEWARSAEMEALQAFTVPPNCRRLVHRWRDRQQVPDVERCNKIAGGGMPGGQGGPPSRRLATEVVSKLGWDEFARDRAKEE